MFRKLLVPLDRSSFAEQALGPATAIARASGAAVDLVMAHEPRPLAGAPDVAWHAEQIDGEEEYLAEMAAQVGKRASISVSHAVVPGETVSAICKRRLEVKADLVVMTTHGRTGIKRAWVGSIADGVLRRSGVPVLMCRPAAKASRNMPFVPFKKILVLTDGSIASMGVMKSAISLAKSNCARLCLLRIVQPVQLLMVETAIPFAFPLPAEDEISTERMARRAKLELAETARDMSEKYSVDIDSHVLVAREVAEAIIDFALRSGIDAIAMSTHGRGASRLVLGSVADKIIHAAALPMLVQAPADKSEEVDVIEEEEPQSANVLSM
jgi:Universal stress protein UspA and related nucleotide-binding proteins